MPGLTCSSSFLCRSCLFSDIPSRTRFAALLCSSDRITCSPLPNLAAPVISNIRPSKAFRLSAPERLRDGFSDPDKSFVWISLCSMASFWAFVLFNWFIIIWSASMNKFLASHHHHRRRRLWRSALPSFEWPRRDAWRFWMTEASEDSEELFHTHTFMSSPWRISWGPCLYNLYPLIAAPIVQIQLQAPFAQSRSQQQNHRPLARSLSF